MVCCLPYGLGYGIAMTSSWTRLKREIEGYGVCLKHTNEVMYLYTGAEDCTCPICNLSKRVWILHAPPISRGCWLCVDCHTAVIHHDD